MKKFMNFALMAALTVGLSLAATSCKDDDNSENNGGQPTAEEQASEDANTFWSVAANLVNSSDVTTDYKDKTFEPTIGEAEDGNSTVRVVTVPDLDAAAAHFAAIVNADVNEATTTYTYQDDAVGTLTYTKSTDGKSLAKVDVSIAQIPHLQQIVYKTVEQMGDNAVTDGVPYYSFGDVIRIGRGNLGYEYLMCIQAPFTKEGYEKCVWASVAFLLSKNIWSYTASNGYTYRVPTNLGTNEVYMKNMAEMLYAIADPDQWWDNMNDGPKDMKAFNMVRKQNAKYINQNFWKRVAKQWQDRDLANTIFGVDMETLKDWLTDSDKGMKLLYKGYSWWTWYSNNLTLYEASAYTGQGKEANARHLTMKEVTKNVIKPEKIEVNCVTQLKDRKHWICPAFFGDDQPRFFFQFAPENPKFNPYESYNRYDNVEDVYVYTKEYNITVGPRQKMDNYIVTE